MPNEPLYSSGGYDSKKSLDNSDYVHNPSTPPHCCDNDKCECHHPLRLWSVKYEVLGVPKFTGVATVQAKDLCDAEFVFIQNSKFNGMREYLKITCIDELYPNPEPLILQEDSAAILDKKILKTYPFLLKSEYDEKSQELNDTIIQNVQDYIGDIRPHIDSTTGNWFIGDQDTGVHAQGDKGEDGDDGFSPSVSVSKSGNTTTISVTDEQGTTSSTITDGSNGESAYEIWLEQGHTGTEEDFLEWLRQGSYLKQVGNLDEYEGVTNEIVQYIGATNSKYTNGYVYKKTGTQIIIPSSTDYIEILNRWTENSIVDKCGIAVGLYYKTDKTDNISSNIYKCTKWSFSSGSGGINVYQEGNNYKVRDNAIGTWWIGGNENRYQFRTVSSVSYSTYQGVSYPSRVLLEQMGELSANVGVPIVMEFYQPSEITIFENINGQKIYCRQENGVYILLPLDYDGEHYQVITDAPLNPKYYTNGVTQESITIDTTEWQQLDVQPREDISHFVTDTEIGWIEH